MFKKLYFYILGFVVGGLNGFFGSGGGILAVPLLEKAGIEAKKAHATSIAITVILSFTSSFIYLKNGHIDVALTLKLIPFGVLGAIFGSFLLKKITVKNLKRIFGFILIFSGVRLFLR